MASFADGVYAHRTDRDAFVGALLRNINAHWTQVVAVGGDANPPGDVQRCRIEGHGYTCDNTVAPRDKMRMRALLRAWARESSDRYLDLQYLNRFSQRAYPSQQVAYNTIRANAPSGAVCFIRNEIERARRPVLFGTAMWDGWAWNTYYSTLLKWDDRHAGGVIDALRREQGRYAIGGTTNYFWGAVRQFVTRNAGNGIYAGNHVQAA